MDRWIQMDRQINTYINRQMDRQMPCRKEGKDRKQNFKSENYKWSNRKKYYFAILTND